MSQAWHKNRQPKRRKSARETSVGLSDLGACVRSFTSSPTAVGSFRKKDRKKRDEKPENKETLQSILTYHVVAGKFMATDVVNAINENGGQFSVTTLQGNDLTLKLWEGDVYVKDAKGNKAKVIITDVETSNGVIHAINNVVLPE